MHHDEKPNYQPQYMSLEPDCDDIDSDIDSSNIDSDVTTDYQQKLWLGRNENIEILTKTSKRTV